MIFSLHNVLEDLWSGSDADSIIHSDAAAEQHVLNGAFVNSAHNRGCGFNS